MPARSRGARVGLPWRSTHTGTAVPTGVRGADQHAPLPRRPVGQRAIPPARARSGQSGRRSRRSPVAGAGASSSRTARMRERSAASAAATAWRCAVVAVAAATASGGARSERQGDDEPADHLEPVRATLERPRAEREPAQRPADQGFLRAVIPPALPSVGRVVERGGGPAASDEGAPLQLLELLLADRAAVEQFLAARDLVDAAEAGGRHRPDVVVGLLPRLVGLLDARGRPWRGPA